MKQKRNIYYILFFIGYFLLVASTMFHRVKFLVNICNYLDVIAFIILFYNIIVSFKKINTKVALWLIIISIISLTSYYFSKDTLPIKLIIVLLASKNISFDNFIKKDFIVRIILILSVVSFHYLGLTNDYLMMRADGTIRNSMGFSHPNSFGFYLMIIAFEYIYISFMKNNKIQIKNYILILLIMYIINYFSDSRTSILAIILFLLFLNFKDKIIKNKKINTFAIKNIFIIMTILTLTFTYLYGNYNTYANQMNNLTSNRLYYSNYFYKTYGPSIVGQKIETISTESAKKSNKKPIVLDNCYIQLIVRYGILVYMIYAMFFRKSFIYALNKNDKIIIIIMLILCLFGLSESNILLIERCPFLIYVNNIIFNKEGESKYE